MYTGDTRQTSPWYVEVSAGERICKLKRQLQKGTRQKKKKIYVKALGEWKMFHPGVSET